MNYDYLIIGSGMSALTVGSLLAKAGAKVCLLEAHETPGGYAHTFAIDDFQFCAQVHYIWGCSPHQTIYEFIKKLGLLDDITFEPLNSEGYDQVVLPDGKRIKIPFGFDKLIEHIDTVYPGNREQVRKFLEIISKIQYELRQLPETIHWWHYLTHGFRSLFLIQYKDKTLQDVFDECGLSQEVQAVLSGNAGDFAAPPEILSILAYTSLFGGYNEGAYYPSKHFKHFIGRLAEFIKQQPGCDIFCGKEVVEINMKSHKISGVKTSDGQYYQAHTYICNMDPQKAANMIGWQHVPKNEQAALQYQYSPSSFVMYCGIQGLDLRNYGFGNYNVWHLEQWNMNTMWSEQLSGNYDKPWLFLSTSSLNTKDTSLTPPGGQTLFIGTVANYALFESTKRDGDDAYQALKNKLSDKILGILESKYVPNLRKYIKVMSAGTPFTNLQLCLAPQGNCYGSLLSPKQMGLERLQAHSPWKNLYWCNASGGYPGIHGTVSTGVALYQELTGDRILNRKLISVEDSIRYARSHCSFAE